MKKVLLIEDNPTLSSMYQQKLSQQYEVKVIADGSQAQDTAATFQPDLVLLDLLLPGDINGYDILKTLKARSETQAIQVVILSSLKPESMPKPEEAILDHLDKSQTDPQQLLDKVNTYLSQSSTASN